MKTKILIPLCIIGALAAFFSFRYIKGDGNANNRKELVLKAVLKTIEEGHFAPRPIDDTLSDRAYHKVLENLDYEKKFFSAKDIAELKPYQFSIDDQIKEGSTEFFDKLNGLFTARINDAESYYKEILKTPFTFTSNDSVQMNGEKVEYAADAPALKARWHQYLKYRTLAKYVELKDDQNKKKKDSANAKLKTDAELEAEARASVLKSQDLYFRRLRKIDENQRFSIFVNSITNSEDPHTDYLPPKDKERFDVSMSGSFAGIGAQLKDEDGKIKIAGIITGSPSWKQGELKAGDEIMKVAQGGNEPEDIQGMDLDDVVSKIRGPKGTEVRLTVKKVDGSTKVISIIRAIVPIEETFARSAVINSKNGPVGYIYLPEFYADFNNPNGRRCADDVAIEVQKLKNAGVTGIILDLRNNGGGSLSDVVDMAGLFIDQGPIVQVKSSDADPMTLKDNTKGALYDGPLAIMVNQGSASASEIMAAAMQDYKRAVIVGSTTFGKGTVQKILSLDDMLDPITRMRLQSEGQGQIGALKLTMQKFYRVNGGSTQLKGVTPDIMLPDVYKLINIGERRDKAALPWDEIPAASYKSSESHFNIGQLAENSRKRVNGNPQFNVVEESARKIKEQEDGHAYPLSELAYRKQLEEVNASAKKNEELEKKATLLNVSNLREDMTHINRDSTSVTKNNDWLKLLKKDAYIAETVNIINDMSKPAMKVDVSTGMK